MANEIEIETRHSPEDAARRIMEILEPTAWRAWDQTCLVGRASPECVSIWLHRAYLHRPRCRLVAEFHRENGLTILRGSIGFGRWCSVLLAVWFGGVGISASALVIGALVELVDWSAIGSPLVFLAVGAAVVWFLTSKRDQECIEARLRKVLREGL
jgi:hypothetical protein